jgi:hypothetical protein
MMAKRHDLARPLLQENIQMDSYGNPMWSKSVWALARMESFLESFKSRNALQTVRRRDFHRAKFRLLPN